MNGHAETPDMQCSVGEESTNSIASQDGVQPQKLQNFIPPMAQWAKVEKNQNILRKMQQFYQQNFPMEVRYFLCQWIEEQAWDNIDENDQQYAHIATALTTEMLSLLKQKAAELNSQEFFIIRMQLEQSVNDLEQKAKSNTLEVVRVIKECLSYEKSLIEQEEKAEKQKQMHQDFNVDQPDMKNKIGDKILQLAQWTKQTEKHAKEIKNKQEQFIIGFNTTQKLTAAILPLKQSQDPDKKQQRASYEEQKMHVDRQLEQFAKDLLKMRLELSQKYNHTLMGLQELQKDILDNELISWKRRQQLAGNGLVVSSSNLDLLQNWCESLADLIWQNRQQIKNSTALQHQLPIKIPEGSEDLLPKLNDTITGLLSSLVTSTFIVEQQPPQVLKKEARFGAVVRLLVGGKLNVHMNPPQVKATIISETQATNLLRNDIKAKNEVSGEILNNSGTMEYNNQTGQLSVNFRNMQLKKIKRADKKGSEAVTEEKFCILFQSDFTVGGHDLAFQVWTISLPVVVTVHGNQECNATATVLWDNAFAEGGRIPFAVPEQVEWKKLLDQLNIKFISCTGKGLSDINMMYIASKLFSSHQDPLSCNVSWAQFNKDTLANKTFTFWEWFYAIQKLTKEHLKDLWCEGAIIGFVSKDQAKEWLQNQAVGTFLLRFSDSELGGITIAWTGANNEVWHLAPFTAKDFQIRTLADRIRDLPNLITMYPDKAKDTVFGSYYSNTQENEQMNNDGYIRPHLRTHIPDQLCPNPDNDLMFIQQPISPDSIYSSSNPGSVQTIQQMDTYNIDLEGFTDYMPGDIADEVSVHDLLQDHSFQ